MNNYSINILTVNSNRIFERLKILSQFGVNENGGIDRCFGSESDIKARNWIKNLWEKDIGIKTIIDPISNLWGCLNENLDLPAIIIGSHHDSVLNGGRYDGALGIILATEVIQIIKEKEINLRHPLKVVSFASEEPNKFNLSTLGSRVVAGKLNKKDIKDIKDNNGIWLKDIISKLGGNINNLDLAKKSTKDVSAFIECHIEQGNKLFKKDLSVGVVTEITGIYREALQIIGESNHAGTTAMDERHDALIAASIICLKFERIIKSFKNDYVVGTIGHLVIEPNSVNIIPGNVKMILEYRTPNHELARIIYSKLMECISYVETERKVKIINKTILKQREVKMDNTVIDAMKKALYKMNEPFEEIVSMAGHDTVHMSDITKTGMLFVASVDGKSHCPEESTKNKDIIKAANTLLETILILDEELDQ